MAGIHPLRPASSLTDDEIVRLRDAIRAVLQDRSTSAAPCSATTAPLMAKTARTRTTSAFISRPGGPVPRCGTSIERIRVTQRGTHFCPRCQS